jgi:O-antigen/teichoic acid export membrane protein
VVLVFLLLKVDVFLIDYFLGNAAAGSYRIATVFADMMQRLPDVAGAVLLAKVVRGEDKSLLSLRVAQGILVFSLVAALILLVGGQMLIGLFFPAFPEAYEPLVWMLPGLLFLGFGSVCNTKLAGQGYPAITLWAAALALVINILLNFIFIPMLGLKGAALATSMAYAIWSLVIGRGFLRSEGLAWGDLLRVWELASARGQKSP